MSWNDFDERRSKPKHVEHPPGEIGPTPRLLVGMRPDPKGKLATLVEEVGEIDVSLLASAFPPRAPSSRG